MSKETVFGDSPPVSENTESVFGDCEPQSDFEKKCQALRGWRIGDAAACPEEEIIGVVTGIYDSDYNICLNEHYYFSPEELINLSRGE